MSSQLSVSYQWMSNFQIVQMGGLEDYFPYWHVISEISLHVGFLFMHFQNILFPFKMGIVLMSLKISEIDRVSRGALSFALHVVIVMRAVVKCQCGSCGWLWGAWTGTCHSFAACAASAEKMNIELIIPVIWNKTSITYWLTNQNDSACAPANFMPMHLQLDTNYKSSGVLGVFFVLSYYIVNFTKRWFYAWNTNMWKINRAWERH